MVNAHANFNFTSASFPFRSYNFNEMQRNQHSSRPWPPPSHTMQVDDDENEEEEDGYYDEDAHSHGYSQRPHHSLGSSGLCLPPTLAFAPLAKLNAQSNGPVRHATLTPGGPAFSAPYVYSPRTVPVPPPPPTGFMHTQLRGPAMSPAPATQHPSPYAQSQSGSSSGGSTPPPPGGRGEFMVLRTDRRTGNLQVAGMSQTTHSGAVHAMRQALPDGSTGFGDSLDGYRPRDSSAVGTYVCSVPGCGKRYTFGSNLRRHVRTAHPDIAYQRHSPSD
ncbi:hypothetical protein BKA62DRAFT_783634 [Auriculariales sp. MPI-PUGE-AT-0066]|nr:hypothetical protein BKA62DRAFT_783634 [Auriculariales sp. MPI-PUGE-AT-0066]